MDRFTAKGAICEGLGLIRRRPALMTVWALLFLAISVIDAGLTAQRDAMVQAGFAAGLSSQALTLRTSSLLLVGALLSTAMSSAVWVSAFAAMLHPGQ